MIDRKEQRAKKLKAQGKTYGACSCGLLQYFGESARHSLSHAPSCPEHHSHYRITGASEESGSGGAVGPGQGKGSPPSP